jgi:hypothetical protein
MEILETQVYGGASYWALVPVIRFFLEIGEVEEQCTNLTPGFYEKLTTTLPTMHEHYCSAAKGRDAGLGAPERRGRLKNCRLPKNPISNWPISA